MRWAIILVVGLLHGCAGDTVRLSVAHWSHHVASNDITNERHEMVGVSYNGVFVGTFKNSYGRRSYTAGIEVPLGATDGDWQGYTRLGAVRGYRSCFGDDGTGARTCPLIQPGFRYEAYALQPGAAVFGDALLPTADYVWKLP